MVCKLYFKKRKIKENSCLVIQKFVKQEMNYFSIYTKPKLSQKLYVLNVVKCIIIHTNYTFI